MSGATSRRAFVGGGVALAAGVGVARLPKALTREAKQLAFDVDRLESAGSPPEFGTLLPGATQAGPLGGTLKERGSSRPAGHVGIANVVTAGGILSVHTLDLRDGTIVALGPDDGAEFPVASGTGAYAGARGSLTVRQGRHATLVDVDLEL